MLKNEVYVVGGYIGDGVRSKKIEKYNSFDDSWETLEISLSKQIEASFVLPYKHNSVLMFGGKSNDTDLDNVIELSFSPSSGELSEECVEKEIAKMKI